MSVPDGWPALGRVEIVPTCSLCGVPVPEDALLCDECRLETFKRVLRLAVAGRVRIRQNCLIPDCCISQRHL